MKRFKEIISSVWAWFGAVAATAGGVAGVVALWPIFFPPPPPPPPPPPQPIRYVYFERVGQKVLTLKRTEHAHNIRVTLIAVTFIDGTSPTPNMPDVRLGFVGLMCGPLAYTGQEDHLIIFRESDYDQLFEEWDERVQHYPDGRVWTRLVNLSIKLSALKDVRRNFGIFIKTEYETDEAGKTSRYFYVNPRGQEFEPMSFSDFDEDRKVFAKLKEDGNNQPYECVERTLDFP